MQRNTIGIVPWTCYSRVKMFIINIVTMRERTETKGSITEETCDPYWILASTLGFLQVPQFSPFTKKPDFDLIYCKLV